MCVYFYSIYSLWQIQNRTKIFRHRKIIPYSTTHKSNIEKFPDFIYLTRTDIGRGTWLEHYAKNIEHSNKRLILLNSAIDILRNKHKNGKQFYWILYYSYLSPQQLQNMDEIIESLCPHITNSSHRTYYCKCLEAVQALSSILWEYT